MKMGRREFFRTSLAAVAAAASGRTAAEDNFRDPALVSRDPDVPYWPSKERIALWPDTPPGAPEPLPHPGWWMFGQPGDRQLWVKGIAMPEIHVFRPARSDGSAILAIPGGSYEFLAVQNEGLDVAEYFNSQRTTVFVLAYRLPGEGWADRSLVPLADAQRAMRLIRATAADFSIDPARLGALGFSAGGNLAADLTVSFDESIYAPVDAADRLSARPAFTGLIYPVATFDPAFTHPQSRDNRLGASAPAQLVEARSPERHVTSATPPSFVVHAFDDGLVPVDNSLAWIAATRTAKVPVEAHLLTDGGHGFGLHLPTDNPGSRWPEHFALWMKKHGG